MTVDAPGIPGLLLPDGARLVHIGPHKTGTTSLQAALWAARPRMLEQGVRHLGRTRNPASAARAVTGYRSPTSTDTPPSMRHWRDLVGEARRARESRVVISSEVFAWARPEVIAQIARDLDRERIHVVVTLRPLARILPSQWQQDVQAGAERPYEGWLRQVLGTKPTRAHQAFWWLHRHDELIARWADALGRDRVIAVVVDERDHAMLLRVFEGLLGLREGTLVPLRELSNRSMTMAEAEAVRAFNIAARQAGVTRAVHARTMRFGSAIHMKGRAPGPGEAMIDTPQWALDRARELDAQMVPAIEASVGRVVGDLASLTARQVSRGEMEAQTAPVRVPPRVAAEMAMGIVLASGLARAGTGGSRDGSTRADPIAVARVSTWQLAAVVLQRARWSVSSRLRSLRRRLLSAFEALTRRAPGTPARPPAPTDRVLTLQEAGVLQALAERFDEEGLDRELFDRVVRARAVARMLVRPPEPDEARVDTPQRALDRAAPVAREMTDVIMASGIRVIGDPERLADVPVARLAGDMLPEAPVQPEVAAGLAMGILEASGLLDADGSRAAWIEPIEAARHTTPQLVRILLGRAASAVTRRRGRTPD